MVININNNSETNKQILLYYNLLCPPQQKKINKSWYKSYTNIYKTFKRFNFEILNL